MHAIVLIRFVWDSWFVALLGHFSTLSLLVTRDISSIQCIYLLSNRNTACTLAMLVIKNEKVRNRICSGNPATWRPSDYWKKKTTTLWLCHKINKTFLQGTVPEKEGEADKKKWWGDNIKEWTALPMKKTLILAKDRGVERNGQQIMCDALTVHRTNG